MTKGAAAAIFDDGPRGSSGEMRTGHSQPHCHNPEAREPLRVLVVGHTYVVGTNQSKLAELASRGVARISLLVPEKWPARDWGRQFLVERTAKAIDFYPARVLFAGRGGAHLYPFRVLRKVFASAKPQLVHVEQEVFSLCAFQLAIFCRLVGVPMVVFCWQNAERRHSFLRRWSRQYVLRVADCIVAGNAGAEELLRHWGYRGRIEVMPQLGVDTHLFLPPDSKPSDGIFRIGFVGLLSYRKGVHVLLEALRELENRGRRCEFLVVGSGPYEPQLRRRAEQLHISHLVRWKGSVTHKDVPAEMSILDALVLPTRTIPGDAEQFGHVLIESMSMGIPVVGSSCGEIPKVIGRPELIFPEGNSLALADVLDRLILDARWRDEVSEYGMKRVEERFTNGKIAARLEEVWLNVRGNSGSR